jgi:hypothetical protein
MVASKIVLPKEVEMIRLHAVIHFGVQARGSILEYVETLNSSTATYNESYQTKGFHNIIITQKLLSQSYCYGGLTCRIFAYIPPVIAVHIVAFFERSARKEVVIFIPRVSPSLAACNGFFIPPSPSPKYITDDIS